MDPHLEVGATSLTHVEFLLLGPLESPRGNGAVRLGPPRQRAVLAMLALAAPDVVSTDRLVDGLWGDEPTSNPLGTLQVYVHGVRKALRQVSEVELVERVPPGYRLAITAEQTDIGRFTSLQRRARDERLRGDPAAAAATLEEALSLWRGPALADVRGAPFAEPEAVRLEELRLHGGRKTPTTCSSRWESTPLWWQSWIGRCSSTRCASGSGASS